VCPAPACRLRHHDGLEVSHVSSRDQHLTRAITLSLAGLGQDELPAAAAAADAAAQVSSKVADADMQ
jgi:hypothetical protein